MKRRKEQQACPYAPYWNGENILKIKADVPTKKDKESDAKKRDGHQDCCAGKINAVVADEIPYAWKVMYHPRPGPGLSSVDVKGFKRMTPAEQTDDHADGRYDAKMKNAEFFWANVVIH